MERGPVTGPVQVKSEVHFQTLASPSQIAWDYVTSVLPPSKVIYKAREELARFARAGDSYTSEFIEPQAASSILLAVHPCDLHGILVLERTLRGTFTDPWYDAARKATVIVGLNCRHVGPLCFCASFGTGPFYAEWMGQGPPAGCDLLLTDLGEAFSVEVMSPEGEELLADAQSAPASDKDLDSKRRAEVKARECFTKHLDTRDLPALLMRNLEHPVWEHVAESRCLSCTNCTMVCPTCYCYDPQDDVSLDLATISRYRQWDSCQDYHFAEVHFGNFRSTRKSRLRQFICHKLSYWVPQHGCFGCVGCGRCIRWCPTGIDLTEIAAEIRRGESAL